MKTWSAKAEDVQRNWYLVDATDKNLGRLSTELATILRGKHRPTYTPHVDTGDFVILINADKIQLTGNKWNAKKYYRRSRFFGSLKEMTAAEMREKKPEQMITDAVSGMIPKNKLRAKIMKKLKVYGGAEHPHTSQNPETLSL